MVAGIEPSEEMMEQAKSRNIEAIQSGQVNLQRGSVERLPFWPDDKEGLDEINRTLKFGVNLVLGFIHHSGQSQEGVKEKLNEAGFADTRLKKR